MKNQTDLFKLDLQLFAEDEQDKDTSEKVDPGKNAIEALKKLKENSVSKEDYKKLEEQNRQLLDAIINGNGESSGNVEVEVRPTIKELRDELYGSKRKEMTNLEYMTKTLELRKQLMEQGETDPFVPVGRKVQAEYKDFEAANHVADVIGKCIEVADGDPVVFNNELHRRGL